MPERPLPVMTAYPGGSLVNLSIRTTMRSADARRMPGEPGGRGRVNEVTAGNRIATRRSFFKHALPTNPHRGSGNHTAVEPEEVAQCVGTNGLLVKPCQKHDPYHGNPPQCEGAGDAAGFPCHQCIPENHSKG